MKQSSISLTPASPRGFHAFLQISSKNMWVHDNALLCLSFVLLIFSTIDPGPFGFIVRVCWLASFVALAFLNIGAALAAYISALAIYSPLRMDGWSSLMQRPDNYAVVILFIALLAVALKRQQGRPRFFVYILAAVLYCILNTAFLAPTQFPALFRDIVIPALASLLLALSRFRERERNALLGGMAVIGTFMGLVSILEGLHASSWALPLWVGNQTLLPLDPFLGDNEGRAGGTLMLPAFNGLLLSLILLMMFPLVRRGKSLLVTIAMCICAAGAFFTYERGVWLGLAVSLLLFPGWCRSLRQANVRRALLIGIAAMFLIAAAGMASKRLHDGGTILFRLAVWGAGLRVLMGHPLVGIGFFNFADAMMGAEQGFGSQALSFREVTEGAASHNTVLTILVEFGFVGFLLWAAALFKGLQAARENAARLWGRSGMTWVLAFAIAYLVNAQFISAFEGTVNTAFLGVLAVVAGSEVE